VYLLFIIGVPHLLTETFFTFLLFVTMCILFKSKEKPSFWNMSILGVFIGIITLVKGITLLLLPFLFLILLAVKYYSFKNPKETVKKLGICMLGFMLVMSFWTYRNYKVYNTFVPVSTQGGYALYSSYFPKEGRIFGLNAMDENVRYAKNLGSQPEMSKFLAQKTVEFIKSNPRKVLRLEILKFFYFWAPFDWEIIGYEKGIYNFQYVFMIPFAIFGMFLLLRDFKKFVPLYIPILYFLFMSLIFYGSPRFRMPIEPYLIIFFAAAIYKFFGIFRNKYKPAFLVSFYFLINFIMYLHSDVTKSVFRSLFEYARLW